MKYFLLFVALFIILKIYIQIAKQFNIVDQPNFRSSHSEVTVRGGGIIFPIGVLTWFIYSGFQFPIFFLGLTLISVISFLDDIKQLSSKIRLTVQFGAMLLLFSELGFQQLPWWMWIIVLIITTGTINAFNFMDGINGLTGGYSLVVIAGLWLVNTYQEQFISNDFIYFIAITVSVFCFFNFRKKAICFAGDVGSISIAFIVVFLLAKLIIQTGNPLYLLFLSIYAVDTVLTIIYRIKHNENIFEAHRKHIYQLLVNEIKISHLIVATIYSFFQLVICLTTYQAIKINCNTSTRWSIGLCILVALVLLFAGTRYKINENLTKQ